MEDNIAILSKLKVTMNQFNSISTSANNEMINRFKLILFLA